MKRLRKPSLVYLKYSCLINIYLVFGHFWLVFILIILMHVIIHLLNAFNCLHAHIAFFCASVCSYIHWNFAQDCLITQSCTCW